VLELRTGDAVVRIDPDHGGRITGLAVGGRELLLTPDDDTEHKAHYGAFVMAPWAGRTRHGRFDFDGRPHQLDRNSGPHAIHGTVRDHAWRVDESSATRARLSCDLQPGWPWPGHVAHALTLHDDCLELELSVHADERPMPAACGWHPWWRRVLDGVPATLDLPAGAMFRKDGEGIAVPELLRPPPPGPWDDCFTELTGPPVVRWPGNVAVTIETTCPDVVVYDERPDAVCVEPQTAPPDALNHDPFVVEPGRPLQARTTWTWR